MTLQGSIVTQGTLLLSVIPNYTKFRYLENVSIVLSTFTIWSFPAIVFGAGIKRVKNWVCFVLWVCVHTLAIMFFQFLGKTIATSTVDLHFFSLCDLSLDIYLPRNFQRHLQKYRFKSCPLHIVEHFIFRLRPCYPPGVHWRPQLSSGACSHQSLHLHGQVSRTNWSKRGQEWCYWGGGW